MNSEIFSIISKALNRAADQERSPQTPQKISVCDQKVVETLCQSSDDQNYVDEDLDKNDFLLMNTNHDLLYSRIEALYSLSTKELRQLWRERMGTEAAAYMQKRALIEQIAYQMQEVAFGGLSDEMQERLDMYTERLKKGKPLLYEKLQLAPGTILSREYQNRKHVVKILDDEKVEYKGEVYTSLSAVARKITGTQWNGWKFFRVENRKN